ncbi:hypothetical protein KKH13_04935 [Patescibacteria group bacterium]|nr:hypothetical protein [Patescibacteria group bacterium]
MTALASSEIWPPVAILQWNADLDIKFHVVAEKVMISTSVKRKARRKIKLDSKSRRKRCGEIPRGKLRLTEHERYKPFCSYFCYEWYKLEKAFGLLRERRQKIQAEEK